MRNQLFNSVRATRPRKNAFDLSHEKKLSMQMGDLVPILCQEVVPGDKFRVNTEMLMRLAPMVAPVMHRVNVHTHFFFVPNRLVYSEWENFITGGPTGQLEPAFPKLTVTTANKAQFVKGSLPDYLGVPVPTANPVISELQVSALPFRAYQLIFNEYYRDQNLSNPVALTKNSTVDAAEQAIITTMRKRAWEKDYFTSCLPWAQRGGEVLLPGEIVYDNTSTKAYTTAGALNTTAGNIGVQNDGQITIPESGGQTGVLKTDGSLDVSINELRRAARLQEWLEKNARAGSRYIEQILSHFGVKSSDARLQRPEYLGGGKSPVTISEVLSTVESTEAPQGNMAGHGISVGNTHQFKKFFEEHGWIIGICSVLPRTAYQQGIERQLIKFDKFDFFWPEFANIGEQEVSKGELYHDFENAVDNSAVFGYQSRYSEYKFRQSSVHGDFRDNLSFWHMGRIFSSQPSLNESFITANPTQRIFAVTDESVHKLYVQLYNDVKAIRPMPVFGTPSF